MACGIDKSLFSLDLLVDIRDGGVGVRHDCLLGVRCIDVVMKVVQGIGRAGSSSGVEGAGGAFVDLSDAPTQIVHTMAPPSD